MFVSPQRLSADQDIDINLSDLPSVYARIYDLAIIICNADGNVVERVFHERSVNGQNQAVPFATTATGRALLDRAVHILGNILGTYRCEAKRVWWGNPENALGRLAKLNLKDDARRHRRAPSVALCDAMVHAIAHKGSHSLRVRT